MVHGWSRALASGTLALVAALTVAGTGSAAAPGIDLVGKGSVPATALDESGLEGVICKAGSPATCVPKAIFGGFGSDLAWTGQGNLYVAAPDRGPYDGLTDVPFLDRFHVLRIVTDVDAAFPNIDVTLLDTRFLRRGDRTFLGAADAFARRLDPEGIRVGREGSFYISDEYGPDVLEFDHRGRLIRRLRVPSSFSIDNPSGDPNAELTGNTSGRQANRGMEGLAITPDGRALLGIMQNALLQDHGLAPASTDRLGLNNRILRIDLRNGRTRQYVYQVEAINRGQGVSEILAVNDHQFLVLERDNRSNLQTPPQAPSRKKIWLIDTDGATDVSDVTSLPAGALPADIVPVSKTLFIDLLDPAFDLAATIPEKIEGLSWGPDLPDGRHLLYVISDNDLSDTLATQLYAFAIEDEALPGFRKQRFSEPLFPHGRPHRPIG